MNENNGILNINSAASRFCEAYHEFGTSLDKIGSEIYQLQSQIEEKSRRYNINNINDIKDFFNDDSITVESYYNSLNESEKYHDEKGSIVSFEMLSDGEISALEDQVKQMNNEQGDVKLEIVTMRAAIDKKTAEFERMIRQNREKMRLASENFLNEKKNLKNHKNSFEIKIDFYEYKIEKVKLDPTITNKSQLIADYRKQISINNVKIAVWNSISHMADVYSDVFNGILNNISVDMYDKDDTITLEEQYNKELSIVDEIQKLVNGINSIKENYSREKDKVADVEKSISDFKERYHDIANANEFIKQVNNATKSIKKTIKLIEENNDIEKNLDQQTPDQQTPDQQTPDQQTPDQQTPDQNQGQNLNTKLNPNEDVELKVINNKISNLKKSNIIKTVTGITMLASLGLGFIPEVVGIAAGIGIVGSGIFDAMQHRQGAITHKLKKIVKEMQKEGLPGFELGEPDYENGTINFVMTDDDENEIIVDSTNFASRYPAQYDKINSMLDKEFKNKNRGLGGRKPTTLRERDYGELPKVTIDNLQAAYVEIGGVSQIKGKRNAWKTSKKKNKKRNNLIPYEEPIINSVNLEAVEDNNTQQDVSEEIDLDLPYLNTQQEGYQSAQPTETINSSENQQTLQTETTQPSDNQSDLDDLLSELGSESDLASLVSEVGNDRTSDLSEVLDKLPQDPDQGYSLKL